MVVVVMVGVLKVLGESYRAGRGRAPPPGPAPWRVFGIMPGPTTTPPLTWRYLVSAPDAGAANMAWDQALMARARRTGEAVLRVYAWRAPTLSLGRNQTARGAYDLDRAAALGVGFVRRPTGGRALLHHHEVTYSVTAPESFDPTLRGAYTRINELLLAALRSLGVPAELARTPGRTLPPGLAPCFDQPAAGEIVVRGRKLVGSAQWRHDRALLQHGSILLEDDQAVIAQLLRVPQATVTPPAATVSEVLGTAPTFRDVADALVAALRLAAPDATALPSDRTLDGDVERATDEFSSERWTWRR